MRLPALASSDTCTALVNWPPSRTCLTAFAATGQQLTRNRNRHGRRAVDVDHHAGERFALRQAGWHGRPQLARFPPVPSDIARRRGPALPRTPEPRTRSPALMPSASTHWRPVRLASGSDAPASKVSPGCSMAMNDAHWGCRELRIGALAVERQLVHSRGRPRGEAVDARPCRRDHACRVKPDDSPGGSNKGRRRRKNLAAHRDRPGRGRRPRS